MSNNYRRTAFLPLPFFALVQVLLFAVYYLAYYVIEAEFLVHVYTFLNKFISALIPLAIAAILTFIRSNTKVGKCFLFAIPYSLCGLLYVIPTAYLESINSGYSAPDSILIAVFDSLFNTIFIYLESVLLFLLILFFTRKLARVNKNADYLCESIADDKPFDFTSPIAVAFFGAAGVRFVYNFVIEVINTVDFFINYIHSFKFEEIIYMVISYVFILVTLLLTHLIAFKFKDLLLKIKV